MEMLNYITIKKDPRYEYRFYTEHIQEPEGKVIYKGHKLGIDEKLLASLLEYKMERTRDRIYLMDYDSTDRWFPSSSSNIVNTLNQSYESLQSKAEKKFGKFRKIVITRV
jgi:hypothetical protein